MDTIKFKKLSPKAIIPTYAYATDAGMDLYSIEDKIIEPGTWQLVKTGLAVQLPKGTEGQVRSKSGLSLKSGIVVLNSPGTIDEAYRGEICVILFNASKTNYNVTCGQKIAQMVVMPVPRYKVEESDTLSEADRGEGGFGSTGLNK